MGRQGNGERGASAENAFALDGAAVDFHNGARNRQPQSPALMGTAVAGWRGAIKSLKDKRQMLKGDADALICEAHTNIGIVFFQTDFDEFVVGGIFDGVV